jgi:hypothetical protein
MRLVAWSAFLLLIVSFAIVAMTQDGREQAIFSWTILVVQGLLFVVLVEAYLRLKRKANTIIGLLQKHDNATPGKLQHITRALEAIQKNLHALDLQRQQLSSTCEDMNAFRLNALVSLERLTEEVRRMELKKKP